VIRGRGKDDIEMLQLLIDKGVDVNIKTDTGETALMRTKKRRNIEMTNSL
jgi:ankyrin repeat protein